MKSLKALCWGLGLLSLLFVGNLIFQAPKKVPIQRDTGKLWLSVEAGERITYMRLNDNKTHSLRAYSIKEIEEIIIPAFEREKRVKVLYWLTEARPYFSGGMPALRGIVLEHEPVK